MPDDNLSDRERKALEDGFLTKRDLEDRKVSQEKVKRIEEYQKRLAEEDAKRPPVIVHPERKYHYKVVEKEGHRYHLFQKSELAIGRRPISIHNAQNETILTFKPPLTDEEQPLIDEILNDPVNAQLPPKPKGSRCIIKDLYEVFGEFKGNSGKSCTLWFSRKEKGGKFNQLEIHFNEELTDEQKAHVSKVYSDLLSWE